MSKDDDYEMERRVAALSQPIERDVLANLPIFDDPDARVRPTRCTRRAPRSEGADHERPR